MTFSIVLSDTIPVEFRGESRSVVNSLRDKRANSSTANLRSKRLSCALMHRFSEFVTQTFEKTPSLIVQESVRCLVW